MPFKIRLVPIKCVLSIWKKNDSFNVSKKKKKMYVIYSKRIVKKFSFVLNTHNTNWLYCKSVVIILSIRSPHWTAAGEPYTNGIEYVCSQAKFAVWCTFNIYIIAAFSDLNISTGNSHNTLM